MHFPFTHAGVIRSQDGAVGAGQVAHSLRAAELRLLTKLEDIDEEAADLMGKDMEVRFNFIRERAAQADLDLQRATRLRRGAGKEPRRAGQVSPAANDPNDSIHVRHRMSIHWSCCS